MQSENKSVFVAYFLWLVGGLFGLHHLYLRRDLQAFLTASTLGGYFGVGWLRDLVRIPEYVSDCNEDKDYLEKLTTRFKEHAKPPFSSIRFMSMVLVSYIWSCIFWMAIPEDEVGGINFRPLIYLTPIPCALGVWAVGNVGRERGAIWWPLGIAFATTPVLWFWDDGTWFTAMTFCSSFGFDTLAKQWRKTYPKKRSLRSRILVLSFCTLLYCGLFTSYLYFNGKITDSDGEEIKFQDAVHHFFTSPWWLDLKQSLVDTWTFAQHHGWAEVWKQIIDLSDPHGEINAHKVLGVSQTATQSEITAKWRALSREFHPDKVKDELERKKAQERFMEIQQAYEVLSKMRSKRTAKNKKSIDL
ncbi:Hypothetical predicted protein [Cloeon dipterum]|uniref:DnaJ homolog subfamily C member 22 n=2 Tax=Cloeon dipterum TaxID=197152 RepID=A0A8S1DR74_9INSE|nr:Hypothetical predicted protein [Cloeon dipterum]